MTSPFFPIALSGGDRFRFQEQFGGFNELPPNTTPTSLTTALSLLVTTHPVYSEYRQPSPLSLPFEIRELWPEVTLIEAKLWFYSNQTGIGLLVPHGAHLSQYHTMAIRFGLCDHEYLSSHRPHRTEFRCAKCGDERIMEAD